MLACANLYVQLMDVLAWSKDWAGKLVYVGDDGIPYPVHLVGEKLA